MRVSILDIKEMKRKGEKIVMVTAYDYLTAQLVDETGIPIILVGDSLGMVVLGYESTIPVTIEEMLHHCRAVGRGAKRALIVGDMPFMTYHASLSEAIRNAARFIQEGGCQAVKLEGGEIMAETVNRLVSLGIPVMGHIGLTPQAIYQLGGFRVQGKTFEAALKLTKDAIALEQAGAFAIVLECIPYLLAKFITQRLSIPTIGIGAGPYCDGQVQVISDILGLYTELLPKHTKRYAQLAQEIRQALKAYSEEVRAGSFPTEEHSFKVDIEVIDRLKNEALSNR